VLALLSLAAGLIALLWPGITVLVLTLWIAAWALVTGIMEVILAFRQGETAGEWAMWADYDAVLYTDSLGSRGSRNTVGW
jgi:uncharacterized membrane protein HdeD (DUF308 family)